MKTNHRLQRRDCVHNPINLEPSIPDPYIPEPCSPILETPACIMCKPGNNKRQLATMIILFGLTAILVYSQKKVLRKIVRNTEKASIKIEKIECRLNELEKCFCEPPCPEDFLASRCEEYPPDYSTFCHLTTGPLPLSSGHLYVCIANDMNAMENIAITLYACKQDSKKIVSNREITAHPNTEHVESFDLRQLGIITGIVEVELKFHCGVDKVTPSVFSSNGTAYKLAPVN